jgi:hypothetical protein
VQVIRQTNPSSVEYEKRIEKTKLGGFYEKEVFFNH